MPPRSGTSSATMHSGSPLGSSWLGSSPSRQSPVRNRTPLRHSARRSVTLDRDSPSKQMLVEFTQLLIRSDEEFTSRLDQTCAEHARENQKQLSLAASEHERVREGAELERKRLILEQELEQKKRDDEQRREVERIQREAEKIEREAEAARRAAEARLREAEAKKREQEAAREAAEQQRQRQEAEDRLKAQRDQEDAARKLQAQQQEEAARKAKEQEAEKARFEAAKAPLPVAQPSPAPALAQAQPAATPTPSTAAVGSADVEDIHSRYLALHLRMKNFWKPFRKESAKLGNPLKGPVGDLRRDMRRTTGQVTVKREDSKVVITKLREIIRRARAVGGPTVDIRQFIISHPIPALADEREAQYPAILLYAFICFEKTVLKQFESEAINEDGRIVQELGAIAASLFVDKEFAWQGIPLTDLLLAKFHRVCPLLFGISGNMKSAAGMERLGLLTLGDTGAYLSTNDYHQRMQGMGAGYAAITLRAVAAPALPISEYWRALASLCNTPPENLSSGHYLVTKGLVKDSARKVIGFYGAQGRALLRQATVVLPNRAPQNLSETAKLLSVLPDHWKLQGILV